MDLSIILLIIGLLWRCSFIFHKKFFAITDDELEKVSISLHEETNSLKKRLIGGRRGIDVRYCLRRTSQQLQSTKPVHEIIVNQILSLHAQGYSIREIAKRASLSDG